MSKNRQIFTLLILSGFTFGSITANTRQENSSTQTQHLQSEELRNLELFYRLSKDKSFNKAMGISEEEARRLQKSYEDMKKRDKIYQAEKKKLERMLKENRTTTTITRSYNTTEQSYQIVSRALNIPLSDAKKMLEAGNPKAIAALINATKESNPKVDYNSRQFPKDKKKIESPKN